MHERPAKLSGDCGVQKYKAPEVVDSEEYDEKCDFFSYGCLLYFMLIGESPLVTDAITNQISYNTSSKVDTIANEVVCDLLRRLLSITPENRIGSENNDDIRSHPFYEPIDWHQIHSLSMDAPIIITTRDLGSPVEFIPGIMTSDKIINEMNIKTWTYINGKKWQREMLDSVYAFSNAEYENRTEKRRKSSNEDIQLEMIQNDCLLSGNCNKAKSSGKRKIYLFPNRIEIPSDSLLVPIDEILSINFILQKENQPIIMIKSTGRTTELCLSFDWKFEAEQWYRDLLRVWKNVSKLSKNAPKQLSIRRSVKDDIKNKEKVALAQHKIKSTKQFSLDV